MTGSLVVRVVARAAAEPDAIAIDVDGSTRTYRALVDAARCTAAELRRRHACGPIGIHLPRSDDFVAAVLAGWMWGVPVVPLSPSHPIERRRKIATHAGVEWIIGDVDDFDAHGVDVAWRDDNEPPTDGVTADDIAYLIFTSGSGGEPKAAAIQHGGLMNTLAAQVELFGIRSNSRVLWALNPGFDASFSDIGTALFAGATLVIDTAGAAERGADLLRRAVERNVTHADVPPALLGLFDPNDLSSADFTIVIGGEVCPAAVVRRWAAHCRLFNVYGPTETSICSSVSRGSTDWSAAWIGTPLPNVVYRVVDAKGTPASDGVGELWIGGIGVATGYVDDPEQTRRRFVMVEGERFFRTGDRVRRHEDGRYEFLGRIDRQLKVHGQLVAPEEIEATLVEHPSIRAAVVRPVLDAGGQTRLVASIETTSSIDPDELRTFLRALIPSWMIPGEFVFDTALPKNENLKLDTKRVDANVERTSTIFSRVLGRVVGPDEDFFAAGGDSLGVLHVVAGLSQLGSAATPDLLRLHPTPRALAAALDSSITADAASATKLLKHVELPAGFAETVAAATSSGATTDILVTGATGFLGGYVVRQLLRETSCTVHCLVRANDDAHAMARLARVTDGTRSNVRAVRGDLAKSRFGLTSERWQELAESCSEVFHIGAETSISATYEDLEPTNVFGTKEVLAFAAAERRKFVHYASTLSVFVSTDAATGTFHEADSPTRAGAVYGGYAQSKWVAELCCERARALGLQVAIIRLGLITGDTQTGRMNADDLLARFLHGLREQPLLSRHSEDLAFDVTPVDYAAQAIVGLAQARGEGAFHIANPRSVSLAALVAALDGNVRFVGQVPPPPTLAAHLAQSLADPALRRLHRSVDLFQATGASFDTTRATRLLEPLGIFCPAADADLLRRYFASGEVEPVTENRGTQ